MDKREINYLGALLHDIGKFKWRSQPLKAGDNHEKLGEEFIREHLGKIILLKEHIEDIIFAANRNAPKIQIADETSAQERQGNEAKSPRRPLVPVFQRVNIGKEDLKDEIYYYHPSPLKLKTDIPDNSKMGINSFSVDDKLMIDEHEDSWNKFINELKNLRNIKSFKAFIETFYDLMHKYTSKILSAGYLSYPDISLFDHSRSVAALSLCYNEGEKEKECLLIYGDISGIQNYIYNDVYTKDKIAKKLRGRSFYVSLLGDTISRYLVDELNLYIPNLLYNGGGHFLLLAPNNSDIKSKLSELEKKINTLLFNKYSGKLQLIIGTSDETADNIINDFSNCYKNVKNNADLSKRKKSFSILNELFKQNPINIYVTEQRISHLDKEEETIGTLLPKSDYLFEIKTKDDKIEEIFPDIIKFKELDKYWLLSNDFQNKDKFIKILSDLNKIKCEYLIINKINNTDFTEELKSINHTYPVGVKFKFIGTYIPVDKNKNPLTFEKLAEINSKDYPLLGIARMDVDSLGSIFAFGLKENVDNEKKYTISRIASLSRELDNFFTGNINLVAEKHKVYIAYSGGDDIFAVGSWVQIIEFVKEIQELFTKFTCSNGNLTISCGIVFTKPNFPIANSSILAGIEEKNAKETDKNQNCVSVFFTPVKWNTFKDLLKLGNDILNIVDNEDLPKNKQLPRSFIHSLLDMTQKCFDKKGNANTKMILKVKARMHYAFARRGIGAKEIKEKSMGFITDLARYFINQEDATNFYREFKIPASYVIYKTRSLK
jgi:CRISPR-associated protein Csm1